MPLFVFEGYMDLVTLKGLIEKKVNELGYELYSLSFSKETLSLVVDKETEIDMDMIVSLTNELNSYLDELNPFEKAYTLDISSLGAEKPLKVEKDGVMVDLLPQRHRKPLHIKEFLIKE